MMISIQQMQNGINRFVEQEIASQMNGWQKLAVETVVGLYVANLPQYIQQIGSNPMLAPLGLIENGMINLDAVYAEAAKHFNSPLSFQVPTIGAFEFTKANLDTLYTMIKQGGSGYGAY